MSGRPVLASGGVSSVEDVRALADLGVEGVVVGKALYEGTLSLADVHGVLAYYYRHQAEVDEYVQRRRGEADNRQQEIEETRPTFADVKAGLPARRKAAHAPPAEG